MKVQESPADTCCPRGQAEPSAFAFEALLAWTPLGDTWFVTQTSCSPSGLPLVGSLGNSSICFCLCRPHPDFKATNRSFSPFCRVGCDCHGAMKALEVNHTWGKEHYFPFTSFYLFLWGEVLYHLVDIFIRGINLCLILFDIMLL